MIRIVFVIVAAGALLAGCKTRNELSCEAPENMDLAECRASDAQPACSATGECSVGVCKMPENVCVPCLLDTDCTTATTPVCNQTTNTCEACDAHADCPSNACDLDTGACFAETDVAYVASGGAGACTKAAPCGDLDAAIAADKPVIRVVGATIITVNTQQDLDRDVRIFGDLGAGFKRSTTGPIVGITLDRTVEISDLVLREALGANGDAILMSGPAAALTLQRVFLLANGGRGINATAGDTLTVRRSVLATNNSGGIDLRDLKFDIANTIIAGNGAGGSAVGGIRIGNQDAGSSLQFTTIAANVTGAADTIHAGVNCDTTTFTAANNIVTSNALDTACAFTFSMFDGSTAVLPSGTGNKSGDPKFDDVDTAKADKDKFYRLKDGSPAIDQADPNATEATDIDGDTRPKGTARDMGADEH